MKLPVYKPASKKSSRHLRHRKRWKLLRLKNPLWHKKKPGLPKTPQTDEPGPWDLNSFYLYKTKSSQAAWAESKFRYQVPMPESIAGVIFTHAEVDASKFKSLKIQINRMEEQPYPENLRIEMRSGERVLRVFTAELNGTEQEFSFPIRFSAPSLLSEIALIITHTKAGSAKEGGFQIRRLSLS